MRFTKPNHVDLPDLGFAEFKKSAKEEVRLCEAPNCAQEGEFLPQKAATRCVNIAISVLLMCVNIIKIGIIFQAWAARARAGYQRCHLMGASL